MAKKDILIHIRSALDAAGINATKQQVDQMASHIAKANKDSAAKSSNSWTEFYSKVRVIVGAVQTAWNGLRYVLSKSFRFETQTRQFKTLIGNIDEARAHMADLKALGDTPPFSLDQFAAASRSLMVMSDGVLGFKSTMELVGDAAAATGVNLETMGHAVGRLYSFIRDGQPISRAVMELRNFGVLSPQVCQDLQDMQAAGASNAEMWRVVREALERYKGAMAETEATGEGLMAAISTRWDNLVRQFGDAFTEAAKGGMADILKASKDLEESGAIKVWAEDAVSWLEKVVDGAKMTGNALGWLYEKTGAKWLVENVNAADRAITNGIFSAGGKLAAGGSLSDAGAAFADEWAAEFSTASRQRAAEFEAERLKRARDEAREDAEKNDREAAERKAAEEKKIAEDLAKHQQTIARRQLEENLKEREREEKRLIGILEKEYREKIARADKRAADLRSGITATNSKFDDELAALRDPTLRDQKIEDEKQRASAIEEMQKQIRAQHLEGQVSTLADILRTGGEEAFNAEIEARRKNRNVFAADGRGGFTYGFRDNAMEQLVRAGATYEAGQTQTELLRKIETHTKGLGEELRMLLSMKDQ